MPKRQRSATVSNGANTCHRRLLRHHAGACGRAIRTLLLLAACALLPACAATPATPTAAKPDAAYVKAAWAYFKHKCDTEAGEKIYKTYTGVKSVLVVKPLPPATEKDLYDQFWYGDPYSNATPWDRRAQLAASVLADPEGLISMDKTGRGYDFVESLVPSEKDRIVKYFFPENSRKSVAETVTTSVSRFGLSWEDISTPDDRKFWVAGSRLRVIDLANKSVVAERVGYLIESGFGSTAGQRRPWLTARGPNTTCPAIREGHHDDRWFVLKVLNPIEGKSDGK